jgi:cyclase
MKKLYWILGLAVVVAVPLGIYIGPTAGRFLKVSTIGYDPQLMIFIGGGGNSLVLPSPDHKQVLIVDTKLGSGAQRLKQYVASLGTNPQVTIVNTHDHGDHTGGNKLFPQARIIAGDYPGEQWRRDVGPKLPDETIVAGAERTLTFGDETVKIYNVGRAHTTNDLVVFLVNRQLLHTGDLVFNGWYPVLRKESGANVAAWIRALDYVLAHYNPKVVVPGHGPLTDKNEIITARDYFASIYDAVGDTAKLAVLKRKYAGYYSLMGLTGFAQTVKFIEAEKKEAQSQGK